jgi:hypothetical protein
MIIINKVSCSTFVPPSGRSFDGCPKGWECLCWKHRILARIIQSEYPSMYFPDLYAAVVSSPGSRPHSRLPKV